MIVKHCLFKIEDKRNKMRQSSLNYSSILDMINVASKYKIGQGLSGVEKRNEC